MSASRRFTVSDLLDAVRRRSLLAARPWHLLGRSRECAEGGLEGGQTAADHVGLLQVAPPGAARHPSPSGQPAARRACRDPGAVGGVLRDLLAQGVQRLRQIIGAPLDIGPPGGRVGGGQPAGASATLIASCRAEPFAYASTSLDRQPAAAAERRRAERAIKAIRPARTRTPSRTQSQIKLVPEDAAGAAEPVAGAVGADVTVTV